MTATQTRTPEEEVVAARSLAVPVARGPVLAVTLAVVALLAAFAGRYGYHADELYFRLLGERGPEWGYIDQPPLLPLLVHGAASVLGDALWAIRVPAMLCAAAVVVLSSMIAAELGGGRRAQLLSAFGMGTSMMVLTFGHFVLTSSVDMVMWAVVLLFVLRALLRAESRWWLAVGAVVGVALYAKYIVVLLPVSLLIGLALVGPQKVFRDRNLYLGMGLALLIGLPNLIYQVRNDFPQLQMAQALGEIDGEANRALVATNLLFLLGPGLAVFWITGVVGTLRERPWRPLRALGLATCSPPSRHSWWRAVGRTTPAGSSSPCCRRVSCSQTVGCPDERGGPGW